MTESEHPLDPSLLNATLPVPLASFLPPEVMLKVLLEVRRAGQAIPLVYSPTDGSDAFPLGEDCTRALNQLSSAIAVAFMAEVHLTRMPSYWKAEALRYQSYRKYVRGLITALQGPDAGWLHWDFCSIAFAVRRETPERVVPELNSGRNILAILEEMNQNIEERLGFLDIKIDSHRATSRGRSREVFFTKLEDTFRKFIAEDKNWQPQPRWKKIEGADPFSIFVSSVSAAKGKQISAASAVRKMSGVLAKRRARTLSKK